LPYLPENSIVYTIEDLIEKPESIQDVLASLLSGCSCAIIDSPFTATVDVKGFRVNKVIGVGSIVCEPSCGVSRSGYRLTAPAWGQGRIIRRGLECLYYGNDAYRAQLASLGFKVINKEFNDIVEAVTRGSKRGVIILDEDAAPLEVEPTPGTCGVLRTTNPLHPAAALGKPRLHGCARPLYRLTGPLARLATPLLYLEDKDNTVVSKIEGLGSALVLHSEPAAMTRHLQLAAWLGVLYECGAAEEHL